jgi:hypothetical protein
MSEVTYHPPALRGRRRRRRRQGGRMLQSERGRLRRRDRPGARTQAVAVLRGPLPEALDTGNAAALAAVMDPDRPVLGPRLAAALVAAWKAMASEARLVSAFPDPVSWRAMALPTSRLLDPSWLYTAVTRARQQVIKLLTNLPHLGRNLTDLHARVPGSRTGDVRTCSGSKDDAGWPESSR